MTLVHMIGWLVTSVYLTFIHDFPLKHFVNISEFPCSSVLPIGLYMNVCVMCACVAVRSYSFFSMVCMFLRDKDKSNHSIHSQITMSVFYVNL